MENGVEAVHPIVKNVTKMGVYNVMINIMNLMDYVFLVTILAKPALTEIPVTI